MEAMRLDMPLRVGSAGGHGPIRYHVVAYRPGRLLRFEMDDGSGLHGTHTFTVEPLGEQACRVRHEIRGWVSGSGRLLWPLAVRWLHDAVLEDLLDRVERELGTGPARPARWSPWVRLLRASGAASARGTATRWSGCSASSRVAACRAGWWTHEIRRR